MSALTLVPRSQFMLDFFTLHIHEPLTQDTIAQLYAHYINQRNGYPALASGRSHQAHATEPKILSVGPGGFVSLPLLAQQQLLGPAFGFGQNNGNAREACSLAGFILKKNVFQGLRTFLNSRGFPWQGQKCSCELA